MNTVALDSVAIRQRRKWTRDSVRFAVESVLIDGLATKDINGLLVARSDGRPIAHRMTTGDADATAALIATTLQVSQRLVEQLGPGALSEATLRSEQGVVVVLAIHEQGRSGDEPTAMLTIFANRGANVGMLQLLGRKICQQLAAVLSQSMRRVP
jgi:predicted regulator of Ras-like GTPase activity (Roadblock/LC7/MglB family)